MSDKKYVAVYSGLNFGKTHKLALELAQNVSSFLNQGGQVVEIQVMSADFESLKDRVEKLEKENLEYRNKYLLGKFE